MPGPSFRPFLGAIGTFLLLLGLVFGGWLLLAGVIALILTLVGWLVDALGEYDKTVEADRTGHLQNLPRPRVPKALLWTITIVVAVAFVVQVGWLPPSSANGGSARSRCVRRPGRLGRPAGPAHRADPAVGRSGGSGAPPGGGTGDVSVTAKNVTFVETTLELPADKSFTISFDNEDPGTPTTSSSRTRPALPVFKGEIFSGVDDEDLRCPRAGSRHVHLPVRRP